MPVADTSNCFVHDQRVQQVLLHDCLILIPVIQAKKNAIAGGIFAAVGVVGGLLASTVTLAPLGALAGIVGLF